MKRFDYLQNDRADALRYAASLRLPRRWQPVSWAAAALLLAAVGATLLESARVSQAQGDMESARERFEQTRTLLAATHVDARAAETLLARDRAVRGVRLSGPTLARRVAAIGNLTPRHVALSALQAGPGGYAVSGFADDLHALDVFLANLVAGGVDLPGSVSIRRQPSGRGGGLQFDIGQSSHG